MGNSCFRRKSDKKTPSEQSGQPLSDISTIDHRRTDQPGSDQTVTDQPNTDKQSPNMRKIRSSSKKGSPSPEHDGVPPPKVRKTHSSDTYTPVDGADSKHGDKTNNNNKAKKDSTKPKEQVKAGTKVESKKTDKKSKEGKQSKNEKEARGPHNQQLPADANVESKQNDKKSGKKSNKKMEATGPQNQQLPVEDIVESKQKENKSKKKMEASGPPNQQLPVEEIELAGISPVVSQAESTEHHKNNNETYENKEEEMETETTGLDNEKKPDLPTIKPGDADKKETETMAQPEQDKRKNKEKKRELKEVRNANIKLQTEVEELQNQLKTERETKERAISEIRDELEKSEREKKNLDRSNTEELRQRDYQISKLKEELKKLNDEKDSLLTRLSAVAGARLMDNNPNIADLSDTNRPTKLAEHYSELYDNQWTDAFSEFETDGLSEEKCIELLLHILITVYKTCEEKAELQNKDLVDSASVFLKGSEFPPEMRKHFKESRKKNFKKYLPELEQALGSKLKQVRHMTEKRLEDAKVYTTRCVEICWLMCIQDPPVFMDCEVKLRGEKFDKSKYKEYTKSGPVIEFVVWPVLYLQKDGAMLCKGTAQCMKSKDDSEMVTQKKKTVVKVGAKTLPIGANLESFIKSDVNPNEQIPRPKSEISRKAITTTVKSSSQQNRKVEDWTNEKRQKQRSTSNAQASSNGQKVDDFNEECQKETGNGDGKTSSEATRNANNINEKDTNSGDQSVQNSRL